VRQGSALLAEMPVCPVDSLTDEYLALRRGHSAHLASSPWTIVLGAAHSRSGERQG
jgi:hypothetical protein